MNFLKKWLKRKPKTDWELCKLVREMIESEGPYCDLNFIDLSNVTSMSELFKNSKFNGDISQWDVSRVKDMYGMFQNSKFNGDISKWNVHNVTRMEHMFEESEFNGDISKWNTSKVESMHNMFRRSKFHGDLSKWKIPRKCVNMLADTKYSLEEVSALLDKHYHLYTDPRDGNVYRTCKIGGKTWLAENLRWRPSDEHDAHCYVWEDKKHNRSDEYGFSATRCGIFDQWTHKWEYAMCYWTSSINDEGINLYFFQKNPDLIALYRQNQTVTPDLYECFFHHGDDSYKCKIPVRCVKD